MDISLLDSIIISEDSHYSLADEVLFENINQFKIK